MEGLVLPRMGKSMFNQFLSNWFLHKKSPPVSKMIYVFSYLKVFVEKVIPFYYAVKKRGYGFGI